MFNHLQHIWSATEVQSHSFQLCRDYEHQCMAGLWHICPLLKWFTGNYQDLVKLFSSAQ